MATPYQLSPDGIEVQACNATGHFALTVPLLPLLKKTAAMPDSHVRIVNVTSMGYRFAQGTIDFSTLEDLNEKSRSTWGRYGLSKLSVSAIFASIHYYCPDLIPVMTQNILFTNELQKRLIESGSTNVYCISLHPGNVATEIGRGAY